MNVLITGASGFLGWHVLERFRALGLEVTGFDSAAPPDNEIHWIVGDLRDRDAVEAAAKGQDVICHLGAIGDVYLAGEQPWLAAEVNAVGSAHIAHAALAADARVIYASTWEVYGEPQYEPLDESHPCRPDHPYNITKLAGESLLLAAAQLQGLSVLSLRLGTAYGTGLRPNSVFRIFIDRARRGEPITIQGDGSQGRQFTHASDIADAFVLAARSSESAMALNTVADRLVSIGALAELVVARYPTDLAFGDPRPGDVPSARVSSAQITAKLGWEPVMPFESGLEALFEEAESRPQNS